MPAKPPAKTKAALFKNRIVGHAEVDPRKLTRNPANWRIHPLAQTRALDAVLSEVGWIQSVIVNKNTNRICDGHARVAAAIERGEATVPVVLVDLTETEEKKMLAVLDPLAGMAEMDDDKLRALLADIDFAAAGARDLLDSLGEACEAPKKERGVDDIIAGDQAAALLAKWKVETGQLWQAGAHRILCGDSLAEADRAHVLNGETPSVIFTDIPYGIGYGGGRTTTQKAKGRGEISGDADKDVSRFVAPLLTLGAKDVWVCCSPRNLVPAVQPFDAVGGVTAVVVWDKCNAGLGWGWIRHQCEFVLFWTSRQKPREAHGDTDLWSIARDSGQDYSHETQKPVALIERALKVSGEGMVFDPYCGSGSTLLACERSGRRCCAIELQPKNVAVILERLALAGLVPMKNSAA